MENLTRFAYFGTPSVASETLAILLARGLVPAVVITNADAPSGRGMQLAPSPTKTLALAHGIPVLTPATLDEAAIATIKEYGCEYAIVVAYGKLFPQALIDTFPKGAINVHYSLLPKYRGASPVEAALLNGDEVTGVTIQQMVLAMDAGDILAQIEVAIDPAETTKELRPRLVALGANLLADILPQFERGELEAQAQDHSQATRCKNIKKEDGQLDLAGDARENWNKYRAYAASPGTYFFENGKRMKITKASFKNGKFIVERVVPEGKREMSYADATRAQTESRIRE
jgi:methionyl-tRNA formyltransferase